MKKNQSDLVNYRQDVSNNTLKIDKFGLSAICYAGMPLRFNRFFDIFQKITFRNLIKGTDLKDKKILDVGCGVGRWLYFLKDKTNDLYGIDIDPIRLEKARDNLEGIGNLQAMGADKLIFEDETFDFVNSITVLQHIPYTIKEKAVDEMCRVCKKGGYISIIELIDTGDDASHVFPLSAETRIKKFEDNGFELIKTVGYEYIPIMMILRKLQYIFTGKKVIHKEGGKVKSGRLQMFVLYIATLLSYPIEFLCIWFVPMKYARHGGFLFRKIK